MRRKRRVRAASLGFSNTKFLELLSTSIGVLPVGELGRETPLDFSSLEAAQSSLLLHELFSKYDDGKPSPEKEKTTWDRFHEAEAMCQKTNQTFYSIANFDPFWISVRRRIWDALGPFSWDECAKHFSFGPGATTRLTRRESFAAYKYSGKPESTSGNAVLASCSISMIPLWKQSVLDSAEDPENLTLVSIVPGNSVIAVPKNYKTDRTIAKEPCMNIYIQKGIGHILKSRLTKIGVNLYDQTKNQRFALEGSRSGMLATVDLSMASDTLSYEVVSWLLPNDWWWALEQSRSPIGVLPSGNKIKYQKFSSMGNGYTFELESLIFWAICQQVCSSNIAEREASVSVYGDDLIIPSIHFSSLCERLLEAGFKTNPSKSFHDGGYRESCGKHYFFGSDVTPFYVRKPVKELDSLFLLHNNLKRWSDRTGVDLTILLKKLRSLAPASWREPRLPDGFGDGAFIGSIDELRLDSHPYGWEYWQVKVLSRSSIELEGDLPVGQLMASLNASSKRRVLVDSNIFSRLRGKRVYTLYPERVSIDETQSGLPARVGRYREIKISIPQHPQA